jgi:plastocyanin
VRGRLVVAAAALALVVPGAAEAAPRLVGTVGPGSTITLKNSAGLRVKALKAGTYVIVVRDRSAIHNFHLFGWRVNRRTGIAAKGTTTWRVRFTKGKTYTYRCDPHKSSMVGRFKAV